MLKKYKYEVCNLCFTYNHAKYIEDAMDSFASQETSFKVINLIVDDASTDGAQAVILQYLANHFQEAYRSEEKGYGRIICASHNTNVNCVFAIILLKYNHFQNNESKLYRLTEWLEDTKYMSLCEGDDWWLTPHKLQKQYNALECNPSVDMCACGTICFKEGKEIMKLRPFDETRLLSTEEVILGGGSFLGTNSLFFRANILFDNYIFYKYLRIDYLYQIRGSLNSGILYLSDEMSAYRVSSSGSWVKGMRANPLKYFKHREKVITALNILDYETDGKYNSQIQEAKNKIYINQVLSGLEGGVYHNNSNLKQRMKIFLLAFKNLFKSNA